MQNFLLLPILIPIIYGVILMFTNLKRAKYYKEISFAVVMLVSIFVWVMLFICPTDKTVLVYYSEAVNLGLKLDGLGKIFAGMVAFLWPIALCYSYVYMKHDARKETYFSFYIMTYGVVLGVAFSANALTMYFFYELLTFITLPLIIHTQTKEARKAGRGYLYYSLSGSSLALAGIIIILIKAGNCEFVNGGVFTSDSGLLNFAYLLTYFGFGVKAAIFPLCRWLPMASAAPTPTTALLHAVAVVKSGAFAVMRMTYCIFSGAMLSGMWSRKAAIIIAALSIVYGSAMALKEQHFKRRFAYSTIANLSYILFGTLLCTKAGLDASLLHFLFHSVTKIGLFFCCGAIIETTGAEYVYQLNGFGKKMPRIFIFFTLSGLSLIGVPLFAGFVSKFYLVQSALAVGDAFAYIGMGAIILSAILTSLYVMTVCFRAFARTPIGECRTLYDGAKEPCKGFLIVTGIFAALAVICGIWAEPIMNAVTTLTGGII